MAASATKQCKLSSPDWNEPQLARAQEIVHQMLNEAPGDFGKLVLMSSLSDSSVGEYRHPALNRNIPSSIAHEVLRDSHEQVFSRWLELVLEEQWKAVSEYFTAEPVGNLALQRTSNESWEKLIPPAAGAPQRELFLSDLRLVLSLVEK